MTRINSNYQKLQAGYLFPEISRRVKAFSIANPNASIIRMGIGDVVLPLAPNIISAMHKAVDEMGSPDNFRGYGPEQGYGFLREAITAYFKSQGADITPEEVYVSDGSKCDTGNIQEIFALDNVIAVSDPVYPVYVDTNVMAGRTGQADKSGRYSGLVYMPCYKENNFEPEFPQGHVDIIYLCSPNNPTGAVMSRQTLTKWVAFAKAQNAVIFFDAAYEAFISDPQIPRSIFEIPGARDVAIEFRSFSKHAGFTGARCAYTVIPKELKCSNSDGVMTGVAPLWDRRHSTKFNGVSYPVQRAAEAVFTSEGAAQCQEIIDYYMSNAHLVRECLGNLGFEVFGGQNAPYVWVKTPDGVSSWQMFDKMLQESNIVITPGAGFGACGEGYFRVSAFALRANVEAAIERLKKAFS